MERQITSLDELNAFARSFIAGLKPRKEEAVVVGLQGDLGSGKTTFTQAVARALGVTEHITSPTFVIEKIYRLNQGQSLRVPKDCPWLHLIHLDAYRLERASELEHLGWAELLANSGNLVLIEWPERVAEIMP